MRRLLVLYWYPPEQPMRLAVEQHLRAFERHGVRIVYHNAFRSPPPWLRLVDFDGVVLSTTFLGVRWQADFGRYHRAFRWLTKLDCPKIALPQDEYDHAARLDEWLDELGVSVVFSIFGDSERALLYPSMSTKATFREALTGYIDRAAAERVAQRLVPPRDRSTDIVYRATKLPYWFGSHGQLKHRLGDAVRERALAHGLRADVSSRWEDTIFGEGWLDFVASGRATVGAESGSSVLDRRGEVRARIEALLATSPELTFEEIDGQMPPGWDDYAFFAVSPRHLEAVITKTCQVLVAGSYSGVLEPGRHYLPIRGDLADLDEALERLRDHELVEQLTEQAYEDVHLSGRYTYDALANQILAAIEPDGARIRGAVSDGVVATAAAGRALTSRVAQGASRLAGPRLTSAYRTVRAPTNELTFGTLLRRRLGRLLAGTRERRGWRRGGTR